jgi:hypothetical protein
MVWLKTKSRIPANSIRPTANGKSINVRAVLAEPLSPFLYHEVWRKMKRFKMSGPYIDVGVTRLVVVDEGGNELSASCGFTIWDGVNSHLFVANSVTFPTPADAFAALRSPDALNLLGRLDDYDIGFAEAALKCGGFSINRLCGFGDGEWMEVTGRPGCFGESYPDDDCVYECVHVETCRRKAQGQDERTK